MSQTSCIAHPPKQAIAIVRQDYYQLTGHDACAAALLNIFEYWANSALATRPDVERPWVGQRPIREFEQLLLGIATDKQIRKRLAALEARGFIHSHAPDRRGAAKTYRVMVPEIQQALLGISSSRHSGQSIGQITDGQSTLGSFNPRVIGQMTSAPSVKQPKPRRSNDRALKKTLKETRKETEKEQDACSFFENDVSRPQATAQVGTVRYAQPSKNIDLSEQWERDPMAARAKISAIAPGHKRPSMVAYGLGQWWVGPGLNDFDEALIQACRNRKRKFQQPDGDRDAKTYLNNMLRNGDWGNLALRCEEAEALKQRADEIKQAQQIATPEASKRRAFTWSEQERKASALGLVQFKLQRGDTEEARAIARQAGIELPAGRLDTAFLAAWSAVSEPHGLKRSSLETVS